MWYLIPRFHVILIGFISPEGNLVIKCRLCFIWCGSTAKNLLDCMGHRWTIPVFLSAHQDKATVSTENIDAFKLLLVYICKFQTPLLWSEPFEGLPHEKDRYILWMFQFSNIIQGNCKNKVIFSSPIYYPLSSCVLYFCILFQQQDQ